MTETTTTAVTDTLFSVLIANYNNGKYLQAAIDSVIAQTYPHWEIVIVDDGSTDNSSDIYTKYANDPRFVIAHNESNKGCGYTKRRCAELANGEICGFLDPDDTLLPHALEKHVAAYLRNDNAVIAYSKSYYYDTNGNKLGESKLPNFGEGETYFDYRWYGCMHFTSYKKTAYNQTEGINPEAKAGVDQDLYFLVEEVGDIVAIDEFCYVYVIHGKAHAITDEGNSASLWYWNLHARYRAAKRRGINVDEIMVKDLHDIFQKMNIEVSYKKEIEIRSSHAYRLGKLLLHPLRLFHKK